jgi:hypothetical protein
MDDESLFITRPDIGACYCLSDAPDCCRWDATCRRWVGPCIREEDDDA